MGASGFARIRSLPDAVPIVKVKRCVGTWLNPRVYIFRADGSVVGSIVYRRVASFVLGSETSWTFDRPLSAMKRSEHGKYDLPW